MKKNLRMLIFAIAILRIGSQAFGFCDSSHANLTQTAIYNSALGKYLQTQLNIQQGLGEVLTLDQSVIPPSERIPSAQFEDRISSIIPTNPTIRELLICGARLEDIPNPRAKHHFYDPYRNAGLDDKTDHPEWRKYAPAIWTNYEFDFTGESAGLCCWHGRFNLNIELGNRWYSQI
ncbi:MAG: hypothetical protein ABII09_10140 [Planctomycetota bacterium]